MPTLLRKNGFQFFFYANEHEPMHIHVVKAGNFAKIDLNHFGVFQNTLSKKELSSALAITKEYEKEFKQKWKHFFKR
ncbi:MAG: DUF4160 domain-containing protein [Deltaproteobacteria bacterium]|nr:DUF4160 domain-containing protein [Deltaproteobacteria bacterium]